MAAPELLYSLTTSALRHGNSLPSTPCGCDGFVCAVSPGVSVTFCMYKSDGLRLNIIANTKYAVPLYDGDYVKSFGAFITPLTRHGITIKRRCLQNCCVNADAPTRPCCSYVHR